MLEALLYAIPLGITLGFAAGPVFFVVIETSISKSKTAAFMIDIGAIAADLLFILVAFYSSQSIITYLESNAWISLISGVAVSAFGLYYLLKSQEKRQFQKKVELPRKRYFVLKGFALNFINIGVFFYWLITTVAIGSQLNHNPTKMWVFYIATLGTYLLIDIFKIYFANKLRKKLSGVVLQKIEKGIGVILILFGIFVAVRNYVI